MDTSDKGWQSFQKEVREYEKMHTSTLYDLLAKGWLSATRRAAIDHIINMRVAQPLLSMQAAARHPLTVAKRRG